MKTFSNANPRDLKQAVSLASKARRDGKTASFAGGGSDLLGMVKERIVSPDVLIHLSGIKGLDQVQVVTGQCALSAARSPSIRSAATR